MNKTRIILASQSPRRKELLEKVGIEFEIIPSQVEENVQAQTPSQVAQELALLKARDVMEMCKARGLDERIIVIGADTVVAQGDLVLGKPCDEDEAVWMIKQLQGNTHQVYTGVAICVSEKADGSIMETNLVEKTSEQIKEISFAQKTDVTVYEMDDTEIKSYVDSGEPMDKAGAYGIQGKFCAFVEKIDGDYNNVVGLPISRVYHELKNIEC